MTNEMKLIIEIELFLKIGYSKVYLIININNSSFKISR